jgi:hypothetical protein
MKPLRNELKDGRHEEYHILIGKDSIDNVHKVKRRKIKRMVYQSVHYVKGALIKRHVNILNSSKAMIES